MALQLIRSTPRVLINGFCVKTHLAPLQSAFIAGKAIRDRRFPKPPPFPYKEKYLSRLRTWFQNPLRWFDENTKIIVVEGSIGAGKTDFAKKLAEELEMLHLPEVTLDNYYINRYGYDFRQLDKKLSLEVQSFDVKDFYKNPKSRLSNKFQTLMYLMRYDQYIDALAHIFNTGQGVVLERCVYSDIVFMETMFKHKYLAPNVRDYYMDVRNNTLPAILRPHLVIYLDSPVDVLMDRIKKRGISYETGSSVLTPEYLKTLELEYKEYLKTISQHSELLFYDWSKFGDIEVVIEDIERIDFENYSKYDTKMGDWLMFDYWEYVEYRYRFTTEKDALINQLCVIPMWKAPELLPSDMAHQAKFLDLLWDSPGNKYVHGFNPDQGDSVLFKLRKNPGES